MMDSSGEGIESLQNNIAGNVTQAKVLGLFLRHKVMSRTRVYHNLLVFAIQLGLDEQ